MKKNALQSMADRWPSSIVARSEVKQFTGGAITGGHLANCDSKGCGPEGGFRLGKRVVYPVGNLISWLEQQAVPLERTRRAVPQGGNGTV